jgi:hypothetical protein
MPFEESESLADYKFTTPRQTRDLFRPGQTNEDPYQGHPLVDVGASALGTTRNTPWNLIPRRTMTSISINVSIPDFPVSGVSVGVCDSSAPSNLATISASRRFELVLCPWRASEHSYSLRCANRARSVFFDREPPKEMYGEGTAIMF